MIRNLKLVKKDRSEIEFNIIYQLYVIGNFITISGEEQQDLENSEISKISTKQIDISQLESMIVEFS